jgi:hypothetical protein
LQEITSLEITAKIISNAEEFFENNLTAKDEKEFIFGHKDAEICKILISTNCYRACIHFQI